MLEDIIKAKLEEERVHDQYEPQYYEGYHEGFEAGVRQVLNDMQDSAAAFPELKGAGIQMPKLVIRRVVMYLANKYFGAKDV